MRAKTYDSKCFELARHFLADEPRFNNLESADTLACIIQEAIEDFMSEARKLVRRVHS